MTVIIVLVLAAAWGFLLVPDLLSRRGGGSRSSRGFGGGGGGSFGRSMPSFTPRAVGLPVASRGGSRGTVVAFPGTVRTPTQAMARPRPTGPLSMPSTPEDAARRRIYVLSCLIAFAFFTLALTLAIARAFIVVHLLLDLALVLFVYMLFERRAAAYEEVEYDEEVDELEEFEEYDELEENIAVGQG